MEQRKNMLEIKEKQIEDALEKMESVHTATLEENSTRGGHNKRIGKSIADAANNISLIDEIIPYRQALTKESELLSSFANI